ncbi:hypothetical protein EYF80_042207 [Liparis tanakae]|uniref:Uncharacterized protein n=1 Tax=Liparis tanakae TaxID=230148 RepID=A0A4Z2G4A6_9TELE|nr:hypothetical protein EYF80_042207 [Liparis tanakae]
MKPSVVGSGPIRIPGKSCSNRVPLTGPYQHRLAEGCRSPDEGGFPSGVLAHQQHHGLALKVRGLQRRGVEVVEEVEQPPTESPSPGRTSTGSRRGVAHLMKVVFPVDYWPTSSTMGLLWKSAASSAGEWKSWKRYVSSSGSSFLR